ncbi:MAG: ABC-2 type transport system ATP-binding protein [Paraglaciecola sp.]|jgi:ABC-2 type transport system ATP-binding protein
MKLTIKNISKTYNNGVKALSDVNLTIEKGMFGLLGPNGAGKSSIMRTLATLQEPDAGDILFDDWSIFKNRDRFRHMLGYLPQEFGVYPNVTAVDLLNYFARLKGVASASNRRRLVDELLELVNLTSARDKAVDTFSGGMKQRFCIAQALIGRPKVIIVDEPTAGLDPAERNRFYGILHKLGEDAIVILSTHIVGDVTNLCKDMAIISAGMIQARGKPIELIKEMDGKLWQKTTTSEELNELRSQFKVIASRLHQGEIQTIIESDECPGLSFVSKKADLEDYYFSFIPELTVE